MYGFLKGLLAAAEEMGVVKQVRMHSGDAIFGDEILLEGVLPDGRVFRVEFQIGEGDKHGDS